jgi:hypothetical protein
MPVFSKTAAPTEQTQSKQDKQKAAAKKNAAASIFMRSVPDTDRFLFS